MTANYSDCDTKAIKTYLNQALRIDQRINSKIDQITSLQELAEKATSTLSETPRSASPNLHPMETTIAKIIDLEEEINQDIDYLVDLKKELVSLIKSVQNTEEQTLLEQRYLCFKKWEQIAVDMNYSVQHVFRLHDAAILSVARNMRADVIV
jgi:seryl-tRNA synthetase